MASHQNDPQEIHNLPTEPKMGEYAKLGQVWHAQTVLGNRELFPQHLWAQHRGIMTRSYFETKPNKEWDEQYAAFAKHMSEIETPELHPEKWLHLASPLVPLEYSQRFIKGLTLANYQRRQFQDVLELVSKARYREHVNEAQDIYLHTHTANQFDVDNFFATPSPVLARQVFPTVPKHQREQWFDLLNHHVMGSQMLEAATDLKRCWSHEARVDFGLKHSHPCLGKGIKYQHAFNYWSKEVLNRLYGHCQEHKMSLRKAMVDEPDWLQSSSLFNDLLRCVNTRRHLTDVHSHNLREGTTDNIKKWQAEQSRKPWIQTNAFKEFFGRKGLWTADNFHSDKDQEEHDQQHKAAIAPLTEGFHDLKDSQGNTVLTVSNFAASPYTSTSL